MVYVEFKYYLNYLICRKFNKFYGIYFTIICAAPFHLR
jgi:hypothetical protein